MLTKTLNDFVSNRNVRPEDIGRLCDDLKGTFSKAEECLILGVLMGCSEELSKSQVVQKSVQNGQYANNHIRTVLELLSENRQVTERQFASLKKLLNSRDMIVMSTYILPELLCILHQRKSMDVWQLFSPLLKWHARSRIWEIAILVFLVCDPLVLNRSNLRRTASLRSKRCRLLLQLCCFKEQGSLSNVCYSVKPVVYDLSRLSSGIHRNVFMDLGWVWCHTGASNYDAIISTLIALGDFRNCELIIPCLVKAVGSSNPNLAQYLKQIAACNDEKAAMFAKEALKHIENKWS